MFVLIDNKEMNVYQIDRWIKDNRNANGGIISPDFAMEVLTKTNHVANIKIVVNNIKERCDTPTKVAPYKEFILSCVDGREMSGAAMDMLQEMAKLCGCEDELESTNNNPKFYDKTDYNNTDVKVVKSIEKFKALRGENLKVYFDADEVYLRSCNLSKVKALKFKEGAVVYLIEAKNLPKDLDVSMCSKVDLRYCDLEGLNLKFREGAVVNLSEAYNLPKDLDLSQCSKVDLFRCDLEGLNLKFREGAEVDLGRAKNLPKDLDVSMCSKVCFGHCDLEGLNLKFREGAEVYLSDAKNLPKDLDFSQCSKVNLSGCDLSGVKEIKFRDKEQEDEFMKEAKSFSGNVVYADEEKKEKVCEDEVVYEEKKEKVNDSLFSRMKKRFGIGGAEM